MAVPAMPQLTGRAIWPDDPRYEEARRLWNGAITTRPALIVQCVDEADAAAALAYAQRTGRPVAVRGGGHNVAGTALVEDGVVIDFSQLRGITVEPEHRRAWVEPGALWGEVDAATQAHGLALPAGIVTHTGVAGLTLGGGFGWLSRRWGLTSDQLRSARLLLADGRRVVVSADSHPDLFWALQGGGGNFGIVTQFEFALHALGPTVLAGPILHRAERASEVLRFYRDFIATAPDELAVFVALRRAPALEWVPAPLRGAPVVMVIPCWSGDLARGERVLAPLRRFGPPLLDLVQRTPYTVHQRMFDAGVPHGWGYYWKSHFLPPLSDAAIAVLVAQAWRPSSPASYTLLFHLGGAIARVPPAASAYAGRHAAHAINISAVWPAGGPDHPDITWARAFFQALAPHATGGVYVNFLGGEGEERVRAAYGPQYDRLAAIKARYDPANVFRANQNIRPRGAGGRCGGKMMSAPLQPKTIRVNDVELAYVEQGAGEPVVFVHGGLNDYRAWGAQLDPFGERYRAVAYSRRHHWPNAGAETAAAYRGRDHRDDLAALIAAVELAPAHVVGSSYGANVALLLAAARPDLVRSLVLGEPPLPTLFGLAAVAVAAAQVEPARQAFARGDAEGAVRTFLDTVVGPGAFDRLPPPARAMLLDNAPEFALEVRTAPEEYFAPFACADAAAVRVPTLLVTGERSPAFLHRTTDELARCLPNAERATVPAASHAMHRENPAAYNQAVLAFLAKQEPAA